jgi:hypothetical protein
MAGFRDNEYQGLSVFIVPYDYFHWSRFTVIPEMNEERCSGYRLTH